MNNLKLTADSKRLFLEIAKDACNWNGTPPFDGTAEERGNLTDLKAKGLLTTQRDEGVLWVFFTDIGCAYADEHGIRI